VSFHKHGDGFFPGTGDVGDIGEQRGRYYSLNVPLKDGTDDATFHKLFKPIMRSVIEKFRPGAIVMQCGEEDGRGVGCVGVWVAGGGGVTGEQVHSRCQSDRRKGSGGQAGGRRRRRRRRVPFAMDPWHLGVSVYGGGWVGGGWVGGGVGAVLQGWQGGSGNWCTAHCRGCLAAKHNRCVRNHALPVLLLH
jgi:hypothetical protein